jgi:ketosteroid isomerase-like protein
MKRLALIILTLSCIDAFAQDVQREIDQQVWKPFQEALMNQDVEKFIALHSKDVVRVEENSGKTFNLEQYEKRAQESWPSWKEGLKNKNTKYTFTLRFTSRVANETVAYETGYYKNETVTGEEKQVSFGKFNVVLRKENNVWKILVYADSNLGGSITEEMFQAAKPIL